MEKVIKNVLIVEDDLIISTVGKRMLEKLGFEVYEPLNSGEKAIEAFKIQNVDLILMDIVLEGNLNGIQTSKTIRSFDQNVPIIFISGNIYHYLDEIKKVTGKSAYISKPFTLDDISNTIDKIRL